MFLKNYVWCRNQQIGIPLGTDNGKSLVSLQPILLHQIAIMEKKQRTECYLCRLEFLKKRLNINLTNKYIKSLVIQKTDIIGAPTQCSDLLSVCSKQEVCIIHIYIHTYISIAIFTEYLHQNKRDICHFINKQSAAQCFSAAAQILASRPTFMETTFCQVSVQSCVCDFVFVFVFKVVSWFHMEIN